MAFVKDCIKSLNECNAMTSQKQELLSKLNEKKKQLHALVKPPSKKQAAPKPPVHLDENTPPNGVSPCFDLRPVVSQQHISEERQSCSSPSKSVNSAVNKGMFIVSVNYVIDILVGSSVAKL